MKIFLMRHGDALDGFTDEQRPLSKNGAMEAYLAGEFLRRAGESPGVICHSALLRARQTAFGVAERLGLEDNLTESDGLLPGDSVLSFAKLMAGKTSDVLIVGHLPFIAALASLLISGSEDTISIKFSTGALAGLERIGKRECSLRFHVTAKLISRLIAS
jgi:phosphohistidine phosphatase SixA